MSSITTQFEDGVREICIRTLGAGMQVRNGVVQRVRDPRGQTAAEYMGVLLLVGMIIAAIVALDVHNFIAKAIKGVISDISTGEEPNKRKPEGVN